MRPTDGRDLELFARLCPDCHNPIMWGKTTAAEWMPLDAAPVADGNVIAYRDPDAPRRLLVVVYGNPRQREAMRVHGWEFRQHHRMSCAFADRWARKPKSMRPGPTGLAAAPAAQPPPQEALF